MTVMAVTKLIFMSNPRSNEFCAQYYRVPVNKELLKGTVPVNSKLLTGTVPVNRKYAPQIFKRLFLWNRKSDLPQTRL